MAIKMNKMQVEAVCEKIKMEANALMAAEVEELKKQWKPTEKQKQELEDTIALEKALADFHAKYSREFGRRRANWEYGPYDPEKLKNSMMDEWIRNNKTIKFDFSNIQNDVIIATLECDNIADLVQNALTKYRIK